MIRVANLDASLDFYINRLGMRLLRKKDYPDGRFTLAFVGYEDEKAGAVIELTYNWDSKAYDLGDGFGHVAVGVSNIYTFCKSLEEKGVKIVREPGPMKHGTTVIAFIEDPTGYRIELIQEEIQ
jgi:lactoylglutathione lyase